MDRLKRIALIGLLIKKLKENQSWCGETHIQKAVYFLKELYKVPLDYEFVLYKFGPFSFDLREELSECISCQLINPSLEPNFYGPHLYPTSYMEKLIEKFPNTLQKYRSQIDFIAKWLGPKNVSDLERISTALFVMNKYPDIVKDKGRWIEKIHELKPHQPKEFIRKAVEELCEYLDNL